jgi:hypothetical protein
MADATAQQRRKIGAGQRQIRFARHKNFLLRKAARTVWKLLSHNDTIFGKPIVNIMVSKCQMS